MMEYRRFHVQVPAEFGPFLDSLPYGALSRMVRERLEAEVLVSPASDPTTEALQSRISRRHQRKKDLGLAWKQVITLGMGARIARQGLTRAVEKELRESLIEWVIDHLDYVPLPAEVTEAIHFHYDPLDPLIMQFRESQQKAQARAAGEAEP